MKIPGERSQKKDALKVGLLGLGLGLAVMVGTLAFLALITNDVRWTLWLGSAGLFVSAIWVAARRGGPISILLLCLPLTTVFGVLAVGELPGLWPHLVFWPLFTLIGWYGFRPGRSAHDALTSFRDQTMRCRPKGGTVLEVDIRKFFDHLDHSYLRQFLRQRVRDGVLLRLIDKWLKAGVMEDGNVSYPDSGSPQGGVVSPMLSNVFLHYVLDLWFENEVKPRLRNRAFLIRFADDCAPGNVCTR